MQVYLSAISHFSLLHATKMVRNGRVDEIGKKIRRLRDERGWTQTQLAITASVSVPLIQKIESGKSPSTRRSLSKIAMALGMTTNELAGPLPSEEVFDENVETYSYRETDIPQFEMHVAAGGWVDVMDDNEQNGHILTQSQIKRGLFEVRVRGDSMDGGKRPIKDGSIIRFKKLVDENGQVDCSLIENGKSYYVQLNDNRATFKRAVGCVDDVLTLAANNRKYKEKLKCRIDEIVSLAVALAVIEEL